VVEGVDDLEDVVVGLILGAGSAGQGGAGGLGDGERAVEGVVGVGGDAVEDAGGLLLLEQVAEGVFLVQRASLQGGAGLLDQLGAAVDRVVVGAFDLVGAGAEGEDGVAGGVEGGREVLKIIYAAYESAGTGRRIDWPYTPRRVNKPIDLWRGA
jgi:hypothetical protein